MYGSDAFKHRTYLLTYWLYEHYTSRNSRFQDIFPMYLLETLHKLALENLLKFPRNFLHDQIFHSAEIDIGHNHSYAQLHLIPVMSYLEIVREHDATSKWGTFSKAHSRFYSPKPYCCFALNARSISRFASFFFISLRLS
ncbi:hypothetical protein UACE39S_05766 [Ureibacillus acetophenoni]